MPIGDSGEGESEKSDGKSAAMNRSEERRVGKECA